MKDISSRVPVNKTASIVTSKGTHFDSNKKIQTADQYYPHEMRPAPRNAENLIGKRRGRLTVIGFAKNVKCSWVVRCDCGKYTIRKSKAIKNENNEQDRCEECRYIAYVKRKYEYEKTGKNKPIENY